MHRNYIVTIVFILGAIVFLSNCQQNNTSNDEAKSNMDAEAYQEGLAIIGQNCVICHSPHESLNQRIAPPLVAVKEHYMKAGMKENEFVNSMVDFLLASRIEHSQMPNAVEKFGLMPNLGLSKEQYHAVATYLYHAELEKPDWFEKHYQEEKEAFLSKAGKGLEDDLKKGMALALATKAVLGKNLLTAIQQKGTDQALAFCNERAIALTDSVSTALNAKIKRVSDQTRNPDNAANASELEYIRNAKTDIEANGQASPALTEIDGQLVGYYPIMTNQMCLQCHGSRESDLTPGTISMIEERYPVDQATGYIANQLRGIWVVKMER